jgi:hypothetical protein
MISELALKDRKTNTIILMHGLEKRLSVVTAFIKAKR